MKVLDKILKSNLIKDNIVLFVGNFLAGSFGYFFHFFMGRFLGPIDYGVLGVLLSIIYMINVFVYAIQLSITKFVSEIKGNVNNVSFLLKRSMVRLFSYAFLTFLVIFLLAPILSEFLKIQKLPLIISLTAILPMFVLSVTRGILQGLQSFKHLSFNFTTEGLVKLILGIIFAFVGLGVNGAIGAIVFSLVFAFLLSLISLRKYIFERGEKINTKEVYRYSFPVIISLFLLTSFYTLDLVLVKHYFDDLNAGYYAAISLLGKIIFFGTVSIPLVMFPKVSENHLKKKSYYHLLYKSLGFVLLFGVPVTLFYFIFPKFTVSLLFGQEYLPIASLIGLFGIFMILFSLIYSISFFNLSIRKLKFISLLLLFNLIEFALIVLNHDSLFQVVLMLVILMSILFLILFFEVLKDGFKHNSASI